MLSCSEHPGAASKHSQRTVLALSIEHAAAKAGGLRPGLKRLRRRLGKPLFNLAAVRPENMRALKDLVINPLGAGPFQLAGQGVRIILADSSTSSRLGVAVMTLDKVCGERGTSEGSSFQWQARTLEERRSKQLEDLDRVDRQERSKGPGVSERACEIC